MISEACLDQACTLMDLMLVVAAVFFKLQVSLLLFNQCFVNRSGMAGLVQPVALATSLSCGRGMSLKPSVSKTGLKPA